MYLTACFLRRISAITSYFLWEPGGGRAPILLRSNLFSPLGSSVVELAGAGSSVSSFSSSAGSDNVETGCSEVSLALGSGAAVVFRRASNGLILLT